MNEIKSVERYKVAGRWGHYDTIEDAKKAAREEIINKYLDATSTADEGYFSRWDASAWSFEKAKKFHTKGYKSGYWYGYQKAKQDAIKFHDDIQAQYKKLDESKIVKEKIE